MTAALGTTAYQGNQAVEFGVTDEGGEILCNDLIDDRFEDSYSIEFWIKPSHYHVGAVVSLVGDPETPSGVIPHGMLLEMGGTGLDSQRAHAASSRPHPVPAPQPGQQRSGNGNFMLFKHGLHAAEVAARGGYERCNQDAAIR